MLSDLQFSTQYLLPRCNGVVQVRRPIVERELAPGLFMTHFPDCTFVWYADSHTPLQLDATAPPYVRCNKDGALLFARGSDVWQCDRTGGNHMLVARLNTAIRWFEVLNSDWLAIHGADNRIRIVDTEGNTRGDVPLDEHDLSSIKIRDVDRQHIALTSTKALSVVSRDQGLVAHTTHQWVVHGRLAQVTKDYLLIVPVNRGRLYQWAFADSQITELPGQEAHIEWVQAFGGKTLVTIHEDGTIVFWDDGTPMSQGVLRNWGGLIHAAIDEKGTLTLVSAHGSVQIWSLDGRKLYAFDFTDLKISSAHVMEHRWLAAIGKRGGVGFETRLVIAEFGQTEQSVEREADGWFPTSLVPHSEGGIAVSFRPKLTRVPVRWELWGGTPPTVLTTGDSFDSLYTAEAPQSPDGDDDLMTTISGSSLHVRFPQTFTWCRIGAPTGHDFDPSMPLSIYTTRSDSLTRGDGYASDATVSWRPGKGKKRSEIDIRAHVVKSPIQISRNITKTVAAAMEEDMIWLSVRDAWGAAVVSGLGANVLSQITCLRCLGDETLNSLITIFPFVHLQLLELTFDAKTVHFDGLYRLHAETLIIRDSPNLRSISGSNCSVERIEITDKRDSPDVQVLL